jgi:hypothetical protein
MRLTLNTDFSLRVLIHVGIGGDKLTTINDIAKSFGISKAHFAAPHFVRFWHKADIETHSANVCFWG